MKKYSDYQIYEAFAFLIIALCWLWVCWVSPTGYQAQLNTINEGLEQGLTLRKAEIKKTDSLFQAKVYKHGSQPKDITKVKRVAKLRQKTDAVITQLTQLKYDLKQGKNVAKVMKSKLVEVRQLTNKHLQWLREEFKDLDLRKTAPQVNNNPITSDEHFNQTSTIATISILTQKQLEIRRFEKLVAQKLMLDDSFSYWKFDPIGVYVMASPKQVQVGDAYIADMFFGTNADAARPRIKSNGQPIPVKEGVGKVNIGAQKPGKYHWTGEITYRDVYAQKERTIKLNQSYRVLPQNKK